MSPEQEVPDVDAEDIQVAGHLAVDLLAYVEEETTRTSDGKTTPEGMVRRGHLIAAFKAATDVLMAEIPPVAQELVNILARDVVKHIGRIEAPKGKQ